MKILVADGVSEKGIEILSKEFECEIRAKLPAEELLATIHEYDGLVVRSASKVTKEVIEAATNLKVIGRAGVGVDNIDIEAATAKGIIVLNAPEGNTIAATEHTVAMMLSMARNIPQAHSSVQNGEWKRNQFVGVEMRGKTLGVIGLGRIGSGVAKRAIAFDMKVIGYDPYLSVDAAWELSSHVQKATGLETLLGKVDYLTIHVPLLDSTKGMYAVEFCGYFPTDNPKYSIIVSINKTGLPASGELMAGDVFKKIVGLLFPY